MNLLNNIFDIDEIEMTHINKKYFIILVLVIIIILLSLFIKKDNYYTNTFTISKKNMIILVDKEIINKIKNNNKIIVNDIENNYSINKINTSDDIYMVSLNLKTKIEDIKTGEYKIYLGKESLFEFIIRIIRK